MSTCACGATRGRTILRADEFCPYGDAREPHEYTLLRCRDCGLVRTTPTPSEGEHELFKDPAFLETYLDREPLFREFLAPVVRAVQRLRPAPGRLVDVGANTGTLVAIARDAGYDAVGLELNEAGVAFAQSRGIPLRAVTLEDAGFEPGSIDAITMSALAEHLLDPVATFKAAAKALASGGILVAGNSPNIRSVAWRAEHAGWYGLQPEGHAWQFTPATLRNLIERHGFRVVSSSSFAMERVFGRNRKQRLKRAAFRFGEATGFGDAVTVVAVRA